VAERIEIEVTQGNLNNGHLYLRSHLGFFPADAVGPANLKDGRGSQLTIRFDGFPEPTVTDIAGGNKLFLRDRRSWRTFYERHHVRAGDRVRIERLGEAEYAVSKVDAAEPRASASPEPGPPKVSSRAPRSGEVDAAGATGRFPEFRDHIARLPDSLGSADPRDEQLLVERDDTLEIYYAPMDWVRRGAKVAIVGITPGAGTMRIALETAAAGLRAGQAEEDFLDRVKARASFSGMRGQLITWLEELELDRCLGVDGCSALWEERGQHLLHPTSCIRYPVFKAGQNYSGSNPSIVRSPMLSRFVETVLADELDLIPDALIVPLGKRVDEAPRWLVSRHRLDELRVLSGFPHPSGANGHRHRQWQENRGHLRDRTADWFEDR
jgi:hypothetical protein